MENYETTLRETQEITQFERMFSKGEEGERWPRTELNFSEELSCFSAFSSVFCS